MKNRLFAIGLLVIVLVACSRVIVSKQPGYDFPATDPDSILVYKRLAPNHPFVIIGRISLDMTWTIKPGKDEKKIRRMAARAGADGIIVTGLNLDVGAFNQYVAAHGYADVSGSDLSGFAADVRPHARFLDQSLTYGYMIKRTSGKPDLRLSQ